MLRVFKFLSSWLAKAEKENPRMFWCINGLLCVMISSFYDCSLIKYQLNSSPQIIEQSLQTVLAINSGGEETKYQSDLIERLSKSESVTSQTDLIKRKKFERKKLDKIFHSRLEQNFPDWNERMDYQKEQEKFYKLAMGRRAALKNAKIQDNHNPKFYSKKELDAIDYFQGNNAYKTLQNPDTKPNKFDTRQSFLRKMHNPILRNNFLNSFNRVKTI